MKRAVYALSALTLLGSCVESVSDDGPKTTGAEFNEFDFTTVTPTTLSVDYGSQAEVYFEVYDAEPVKANAEGTAYVKVEDIEPLYAGYTDAQGRFSAKVDLPAYLGKAYIYTPNVHARTLLTAEKDGTALTASAVMPETAAAAAVTRDRRRLEDVARKLRQDLRPD